MLLLVIILQFITIGSENMEKDFPNNDILLKNSVDADNLKEESSKSSFKYQKKKSNVKRKVKKEANYFYYFNKTYRKI